MSSAALCYHAITDSWDDPLAVSPGAFERQMHLAARMLRPLHVTFDDAYANVLEAIPALERAGARTTVFACAAYGDGRPLAVPELVGARFDAEAMRTLTWDELRGLAERGVEIGSHTLVHARLPALGDAELDRDLRESKQRLEAELGRPCQTLAYPYGEEDARVREAARRAGYAEAYGLPGVGGEFSRPRVGVSRKDTLPRFALKLAVARLRG